MAKDNIKLAISRTACSLLAPVKNLSVHPGSARYMSCYCYAPGCDNRNSLCTSTSHCLEDWKACTLFNTCSSFWSLARDASDHHLWRTPQLNLHSQTFQSSTRPHISLTIHKARNWETQQTFKLQVCIVIGKAYLWTSFAFYRQREIQTKQTKLDEVCGRLTDVRRVAPLPFPRNNGHSCKRSLDVDWADNSSKMEVVVLSLSAYTAPPRNALFLVKLTPPSRNRLCGSNLVKLVNHTFSKKRKQS